MAFFGDAEVGLSIQNVVLGELIWRRGYGYGYEVRDQMREFSEALGYSDTVVYAALDALEKKKLVVAKRAGTTCGGRQANARVYYDVTEAGLRHFRKWMASLAAKAPLREELHMQLMAATAEDVPHLIEALDDYEMQCRAQLRHLIERPLSSWSARGWTPGVTLVQDGLLTHLQTMIEWAQRSRRALVTLIEHPTGVPGRRRP